MKQKDIVLILVMVFIGGVLAFAVSNFVFSAPKNREQTAEIVDVISPDFSTPPTKYFNSDANNPAQPITLGTDNSQ